MTTTEVPQDRLGDQLMARLQNQRIIQLGEEVDDPIANRLCAQLLLLAEEDDRRDILFLINSPGGSVSAGLAIYDTMVAIKPDVVTVAMGLAASMGQVLLSAGTPGKRFALPHSMILMHEGSAGVQGTAVDVEIQAAALEHTKKVMNGLNAAFTGQPVEKIEIDSNRDHWFTANEAAAYGFVDRVVNTLDEIRPAGRNSGMGY
jgi:ATP-dependent Clp protease protease subunit